MAKHHPASYSCQCFGAGRLGEKCTQQQQHCPFDMFISGEFSNSSSSLILCDPGRFFTNNKQHTSFEGQPVVGAPAVLLEPFQL